MSPPFPLQLVMKSNQDDALDGCLYSQGDCSSLLSYSSVTGEDISPTDGKKLSSQPGVVGGNCSVVCPLFYECVHRSLSNETMRGRESRAACLASPAGQICAARTRSTFERDRTKSYQVFVAGNAWIRSGNAGICFRYGCLHCAVMQFKR